MLEKELEDLLRLKIEAFRLKKTAEKESKPIL